MFKKIINYQYNNNAFTLVELAIVLVIVGLLIVGVITGRDLIELAKIRSQIQQFQDLEKAVITFKLKYGGLPGDIKNASTVLSYSGVLTNGNGDKQINPGWIHSSAGYSACQFRTSDEISQFFTHLVASKIDLGITPSGNTFSKGADFPTLKLYENVGYYVAYAAVQDASNTGVFNPVLGAVGGLGHFIWPNVMADTIANGTAFGYNNPTSGRYWLSKHAEAIDSKIDDGNGVKGKFFAPHIFWVSAGIYPTSSLSGSWEYQNACRDSSGNYINLTQETYNSAYTTDKGHCYVAYRITE